MHGKKLFPGSVACRRPRLSEHRGRMWDECDVIATDGSRHRGFLDTTWGTWFYFQVAGAWRKAKCDDWMPSLDDNTADFRGSCE
jgi:hypothetical protein